MPVRYLAMVDFKKDATPEDITKGQAVFADFWPRMPGIRTWVVAPDLGLRDAPDLNTFPYSDWIVMAEFDSIEDLHAYQQHPIHLTGGLVGGLPMGPARQASKRIVIEASGMYHSHFRDLV
jgi:stress responsive alpha/beta barrel protein